MRIMGIVPARYKSSRLPGKPIVDICGKPMIYWVYQQAKKVKEFNEIIVATDDQRIVSECERYGMNVMLTSPDGACLIDRLYEVSCSFQYDYYVSINGDEPLIEGEIIQDVLPDRIYDYPIVFGAYKMFKDPVEVISPSNMKIVCDNKGRLLYLSRNPIPYPHKSSEFMYKKYVGIECYNKKALDFYINTPPGELEKIEDLGTLRFLENDIPVYFSRVESESLSVDTERDLTKVRHIMEKKLQ